MLQHIPIHLARYLQREALQDLHINHQPTNDKTADARVTHTSAHYPASQHSSRTPCHFSPLAPLNYPASLDAHRQASGFDEDQGWTLRFHALGNSAATPQHPCLSKHITWQTHHPYWPDSPTHQYLCVKLYSYKLVCLPCSRSVEQLVGWLFCCPSLPQVQHEAQGTIHLSILGPKHSGSAMKAQHPAEAFLG